MKLSVTQPYFQPNKSYKIPQINIEKLIKSIKRNVETKKKKEKRIEKKASQSIPDEVRERRDVRLVAAVVDSKQLLPT